MSGLSKVLCYSVCDQSSETGQSGQYKNLIIQHMDISEPLTTLRRLLEDRLGCSLANHDFYLQDTVAVSNTFTILVMLETFYSNTRNQSIRALLVK